MLPSFSYKDHVRKEWVDYNGHMNDAEYARVFSLSVDSFMDYIGLHEAARQSLNYTIFTLETHLCYLKEAHEGEELTVEVQLLDDDAKRLHVFFMMKNRDGAEIATSEQMLMGMDTTEGRPAPFPPEVSSIIEKIRSAHEHLQSPKQVGRQIGIKKR
ncbi:thioesterase family protein [Halalkalibacter alkaliphilus]|uniref:Thioesterase family protein n=1 Tax=Halalkalibacter alkaliphilus TaxID=2917993 RepID=A0A9X2CVD3_9BACI|nr:thioesterase family protein [Halalkalibacter alkaliphilus]MCL7748984.1 thioesterase family protein [Halalkalibacter alkaliphilus]